MLRAVAVSVVIAAGVAYALPAWAQSPDPATLAPASSRGMMMTRPAVPHTGVAPRPAGAVRTHVIPRASGLASQSHARK